MKLVAIVRAPQDPEAGARAVAGAAGLTLAEARMRLAPEPPALLARLDPDAADRLVVALRSAGLAAIAVDAHPPADGERTVARSFAIDGAGVTLTPRSGAPVRFAWADVSAILRGARVARTDVQRTEKSRTFSMGAAVATGGLQLTRTSSKTVRSTEEVHEQVIFVYARDGRAGTLAEGELEFSCLGREMQPSSTANMAALARRLRDGAPGAFYDERLVRLGRRPLPFVLGRETRTRTAAGETTRTDSTDSLDTLAEVLRRAVGEGLLP